jgi:ribonuclease P protein component
VPLEPLRRRSSFNRVYQSGLARRSNGLVVHWASNGLEHNRYAVAAKTQAGIAVERNRIRRWGRELFRQYDENLRPGHDIVVLARTREAALGFGLFRDHFHRVLEKTGLLSDAH